MKIYDLPPQAPSKELSINQYYLLVAKNGMVLLSKFKPEIKIVSKWKGIVYIGIINRSKHSAHYTIGETEYIDKLKNVPVSKPYHNSLCFDFQNFKTLGHMKKVEICNNVKSKFGKVQVL